MFRNSLICPLIPVVEMLTPNESEHEPKLSRRFLGRFRSRDFVGFSAPFFRSAIWRDFGTAAGIVLGKAAAARDPDAQPLTEADLARMQRVPRKKTLRRALVLTQEEFAVRYHFPLGTLRDWEQRAPNARRVVDRSGK